MHADAGRQDGWLVRVLRRAQTHVWARILAILRRPAGSLAVTFGSLIATGSLLLALPIAHAREPVSILDALFTATSAVCVTGLTVVDTGADFNRFGQIVILVLIQLGGLGIMTFTAIGFQVLGRPVSFRHAASLHDTFYQTDAAATLRADLKWIVGLTLGFELLGAALLYPRMEAGPQAPPRAFAGLFHAVSAFCNAGFGLRPDNLIGYAGAPVVLLTIMGLIFVGGLGYMTLIEIFRRTWRRVRRKREKHIIWSAHTRTVLWTSGTLILGGALLLLITGIRGAGAPGEGWRPMDALFQSVTARTAGFNTVNIGALSVASQLVLITLMFIGGSPGSCAGGVKTTTFALAVAYVRGRLLGRQETTLFRRRIAERTIARMVVLLALACAWNALGCAFLALTELGPGSRFGLNDVLFEQISAFGTVGLSTGITPELSIAGKLWISLTMFVGRLGPLTAVLAVVAPAPPPVRHPEAHVMIG